MSAESKAAEADTECDVLVIGAGLAGLSAALRLPADWRVVVLCKGALRDCASQHAQGGIAAALDAGDSVALHVQDTLVAGAGLCEPQASQAILSRAAAAIDWLCQQGVPFSTDAHGALHLTREGGHSRRRIAHAADATGQAIMACLWQRLHDRENTVLLAGQMATGLWLQGAWGQRRCVGAFVTDPGSGRQRRLRARHTVLACGGAGQLYPRTTSPAGATADGIALAWRAGCTVQDMEFIQFHPTGLQIAAAQTEGRCQLISEALRGEGALLRLPDGTRFMPAYDTRAELAPRDIVARAIYQEMRRHGLDSVHLDIRHRGEAFLQTHFPNILAVCRAHGIDPVCEPIPVAPLAHYTCGGVATDVRGRSDLPGLYAVGETARTGLHGANRLASNSLLECVVTGSAAAVDMQQRGDDARWPDHSQPRAGLVWGHGTGWDSAHCTQARTELQQALWQGAGIWRSRAGLSQTATRVRALQQCFVAAGQPPVLRREWLELRNLLDAALLLVHAAMARRESCGSHALADEPADVARAVAEPPRTEARALVAAHSEPKMARNNLSESTAPTDYLLRSVRNGC